VVSASTVVLVVSASTVVLVVSARTVVFFILKVREMVMLGL
jgi:hypothetical protein